MHGTRRAYAINFHRGIRGLSHTETSKASLTTSEEWNGSTADDLFLICVGQYLRNVTGH